MPAKGFTVPFIGEDTIPEVAAILRWLASIGYTTQTYNPSSLPEVFIPVVLDKGVDNFKIRTTWPEGVTRPEWCASKELVLYFKPNAIQCCEKLVKLSVATFEMRV